MASYKLVMEEDDYKSSLEFNADDLSDVVANMEIFLKGCGFFFDGALDIHEGKVQMNQMHYVYKGTSEDYKVFRENQLDMEFKDD
jgi:hypothetical protein